MAGLDQSSANRDPERGCPHEWFAHRGCSLKIKGALLLSVVSQGFSMFLQARASACFFKRGPVHVETCWWSISLHEAAYQKWAPKYPLLDNTVEAARPKPTPKHRSSESAFGAVCPNRAPKRRMRSLDSVFEAARPEWVPGHPLLDTCTAFDAVCAKQAPGHPLLGSTFEAARVAKTDSDPAPKRRRFLNSPF